jgi:hypothetical protein
MCMNLGYIYLVQLSEPVCSRVANVWRYYANAKSQHTTQQLVSHSFMLGLYICIKQYTLSAICGDRLQ